MGGGLKWRDMDIRGAFLLIILAPLLLECLQAVVADSFILGCGGFVEASSTLARLRKPSDPKLDYSSITIELHTLDGLVKDSTQCAPNGYYFLPVYDKGKFLVKIRGPEGWSFEPNQVTAVVDQDGCNNNDDINFWCTGFSLSGKILGGVGGQSCPGREDGPAGAKLTLTALKNGESSGEAYISETSAGGSYKFENLVPGTYRVEASHPNLKVEPIGSQEVELGWGNGKIDDVFFVAGYGLEGSVVSQGNPVLGVQVYLYSDDVSRVSCPQGPGTFSPLSKPALCHSVSNAEGKFLFSGVPCGKYTLVPYYQGENTLFDVSPASVEIAVGHDFFKIPKPFEVTGFSVGGHVVDNVGNGIEGVKIEIDDMERATTDSQGYYKLIKVTSRPYTIQAKKQHYKFSSLKNFEVLPNILSLPDLTATHYELCGSIQTHTPSQASKRQVALTHGPVTVKPQTKRTDEHGSFCFEVPPGEYRVTPLTTTVESAAGLIFSPPHMDITLAGPFLDASFKQAQVSISGDVKCKGTCSSKVKVMLAPVGSLGIDTAAQRQTSLTSDGFKFDKILPGTYRLEVQHKPLLENASWDDDWCWEQKSVDVTVGTEDKTGIHFVQKGFWMHIKSSHPANAFTLQPHKDAIPLQIEKGSQQVCLETGGIHELHFHRPCVFFGAHSFDFDTANPSPLDLVAQKYLLTGHIQVDTSLRHAADSVGDSMLVDIHHQSGGVVSLNNHAHLVSEPNKTNPVAVYQYSHWAQLGDKLIFTPHHESSETNAATGSDRTRKILFYPRTQHACVATDGCQLHVEVFNGRPGIYITGHVVPPLAGVNITVVAEKESQGAVLKEGATALWTVTGNDGSYVAGPLYDDATYSTHASLAGFYLKSIGDNSFSCQKLGKIVVTILAGEGAEEVLPSVLLSLSGDNGYRKNAATSAGAGFSFNDLFPGSFYLRPLLKEYSFAPAAQAIEVGSGEIKEVVFSARRIAYSVFGTVTSLSGVPAEGITLEARSVSRGYFEETTTDSEGKYRLRGLLPNTSYSINAVLKWDKEGHSKIERASPSSIPVEVNSSDITGLDFLVFEESLTTTITGVVESKDIEKWQAHVTVEIASAADPSHVERAIPLPLSSFFEVQGLSKGNYNVRLVFGLLERTHKFESESINVDLEAASVIHLGPLQFTAEEHTQKQELAPAPLLPVMVGVAVIAVFASLPRLKDGYQWAMGQNGANANPAALKKDTPIRKPSVRARRTF